jgi:hypothetical protein
MGWVGYAALVYRADFSTLWAIEETDTLGAPIGVNHEESLCLTDGFVFALRYTGIAANTLIRNHVCH